MQPATIHLPVLAAPRAPTRSRAVLPAAPVRRPPALPLAPVPLSAAEAALLSAGQDDAVAASPFLARALAAYRAAATGVAPGRGALGVDLHL